jgi:hypothetical protein
MWDVVPGYCPCSQQEQGQGSISFTHQRTFVSFTQFVLCLMFHMADFRLVIGIECSSIIDQAKLIIEVDVKLSIYGCEYNHTKYILMICD